MNHTKLTLRHSRTGEIKHAPILQQNQHPINQTLLVGGHAQMDCHLAHSSLITKMGWFKVDGNGREWNYTKIKVRKPNVPGIKPQLSPILLAAYEREQSLRAFAHQFDRAGFGRLCLHCEQ